MAPKDKDCFYVLVPVPNNLSKIKWENEAERFKKIIIKKLAPLYYPILKNI